MNISPHAKFGLIMIPVGVLEELARYRIIPPQIGYEIMALFLLTAVNCQCEHCNIFNVNTLQNFTDRFKREAY